MNQDKYWISDLAAVADVSRRTIRYYIQEGLLPQPKIRGKYAEAGRAAPTKIDLHRRAREDGIIPTEPDDD